MPLVTQSREIMRRENSSKVCLNTPWRLSASTDGSSVRPLSALGPFCETPFAAASLLNSAMKASNPPGALHVAASAGAQKTDRRAAAESALTSRIVASLVSNNRRDKM